MTERVCKIAVCAPAEFAERIMDSLADLAGAVYPGYDRVFSLTGVRGTWRPLEGSNPYIGAPGEVAVADEVRIEFVAREADAGEAVRRILGIHPYEEPAIDVIPMIGWKGLL
ncbi:MAG: hypothetical protein LBG62_06245 [Candidatus Methanoplasma sp.]|jgi:hypothetical protein|nr:hypothetical protein [Candidatus Methanoplasma sp.]